MDSQLWVIGVLITSIILIVISILSCKLHSFLALLLASFYVGALMKMPPLKMIVVIEGGIGDTLGFLAGVIGLGTILAKMMEISDTTERIGLTLQKCGWLSNIVAQHLMKYLNIIHQPPLLLH